MSSSSVSLLQAESNALLKPLSRPAEPRHHRANWNTGNRRNLLVRHFLKLAQNNYFAELMRQRPDAVLKQLMIFLQQNDSFRIRPVRLGILIAFIDYGEGLGGLRAFQPCKAGVPHNSEQPGLSIAALKAIEIPQSPQDGVLSNIFRIVLVPQQPAGKIVSSVQVREYSFLKLGYLAGLVH
jgi:hypothetical protein